MTSLRIHHADPALTVLERPDRSWFVSGLLIDHEGFVPDAPAADGEPELALVRRLGDATVVRVDHPEGVARTVEVWRGATSSYEAYIARLPDGTVVVADHFRDVVAQVPVAERQPSDEVLIDHFLFRHARGRDTYARGIQRVAMGEHAHVDVASGEVTFRVVDRLTSRRDPRPPEEYVADLDRALGGELEVLRSVPGAVVMLSGGMDSTLMQSYLGRDVPALHVQADRDDFHLGGGYLDAAAAELGIEPERVVVPTDDYLAQLEEATDGRAVPPHFPQWVTLTRVYTRPHDVFVIGERAGAYARFGGRMPLRARPFSRRPGSALQPLLRAAAVTSRPHRLRLLADQAPSLGRDPMSPDGWAAQMPQSYGDRRWVERTFGRRAVKARYEARLDYVEQHVDLLPPSADPYVRHLEIARWLEFYNENDSQFRSLAFAAGKSMVDPFTSRAVVDAVLGVPATERFERDGQSKYVIERLLRRRVPGYPPTAAKDDIVVPWQSYLQDGPLASLWDRYDVPDLFEAAERRRLLDRPGEAAWPAITWAVWQSRIARADGLAPFGRSVTRTWSLDREPVTQV